MKKLIFAVTALVATGLGLNQAQAEATKPASNFDSKLKQIMQDRMVKIEDIRSLYRGHSPKGPSDKTQQCD